MPQAKKIKLNPIEFKNFPSKFDVSQKVFSHYFKIAFTGSRTGSMAKNIKLLNDPQKALCYHFVCDGMIGNSGFYSILLETKGEFNEGYARALEQAANIPDKKIIDEIDGIYKTYSKWFARAVNPPILDDESKRFDKSLHKRINTLEKAWYKNESKREALFKAYFRETKNDLVLKSSEKTGPVKDPVKKISALPAKTGKKINIDIRALKKHLDDKEFYSLEMR